LRAQWLYNEGNFMKRLAGLFLPALLAMACTPGPSGPEAVVLAIYKPLVDSKGEKTTSLADMPLTDDLKALVARAEQAGKGEPVFDGDFAGNCQDCAGFKDLKIATKTGAAQGLAQVDASFKLFMDEPKLVTWHMIDRAQGWRVDNITSEGIDLRKIAQETIDAARSAQSDEAVECLAYLDLAATAAKAAKPPEDAAKLEAASAAWRKKAAGLIGPDELAQYYASSVAVFDDLAPAELKGLADGCAAKAPA
jgi:hypothetical protein